MNKGILAFDIDGTLTHRLDWIDPKVVQYLEEKSNDGWIVALLTGRSFSFGTRIFQYITFPYVLCVQNGADILEMPQKKHIKSNYLGVDTVEALKEIYRDEKEDFVIHAGIDEGDFCYYRKEKFSPRFLPYIEKLSSLGAKPWQQSDFQFPKEKTFSLIKCFGDRDSMQRVNEKLKKIPNIECSMIRDPIDPSLFLNLVTHPEANKGSVLQYFRKHFQAPFVIAAGDQQNDEKMLKNADCKVVIEGAPEDLLKMADVVAKHPENLGIIEAVEEAITHASS